MLSESMCGFIIPIGITTWKGGTPKSPSDMRSPDEDLSFGTTSLGASTSVIVTKHRPDDTLSFAGRQLCGAIHSSQRGSMYAMAAGVGNRCMLPCDGTISIALVESWRWILVLEMKQSAKN